MKPKAISGSTGLSILFSSLASAVGLCCLAPWVLPLLGVSGAILFARLGPYRPYFIGAAALLMAVSLLGAYRSHKTCAADPTKRRRLMWLNVFLAVGVLVLVMAIFAGRLEVFSAKPPVAMTGAEAMPRLVIRLLVLTCAAILLAACGHSQAASSAQSPAAGYVTLNPSLKRLQNDFNADADKVRLLYIVGGTCPVCLRGMDDLGKALSAQQNNPHLYTYVVYVPALGVKAKDIQPTVFLLPGKYVSRYWDPSGASGRLFNETLNTGGFAWDVWMVYGAGRRWDGTKPPIPDFWMDQLGPPLPKWRYLDAGTFSKQVESYLARVKTTSAGHPGDTP